MNRIIAALRSSFFRWWLSITTVYSASSTCPCCGKPGCPVGLGIAALIGAVFASLAAFFQKISRSAVHYKS
ncbi:MAG: hypothetical protein M0R00_05760 [Candidatus Omnitrophica bacterium]|jgi:hypothetical protein|nr:hypothetical protein [Candidatus Omnitrophota bacterium]